MRPSLVPVLLSILSLSACDALFPSKDGPVDDTPDADADADADADTDTDSDADTDTEDPYTCCDDFSIYEGDPAGRITGVVTGPGGDAMPGVSVTLSTGEVTVTDESGTFLFDAVPPSDEEIVVKASSATTTASWARVPMTGWETRSLHLQVSPVGAVATLHPDFGGFVTHHGTTVRVPGIEATDEVNLSLNLSADADWSATPITSGMFTLDGLTSPIEDVVTAADWSRETTVYDSEGVRHQVILVFERTGELTWNWWALVDGGEVDLADGMAFGISWGELVFDADGNLVGFTQDNAEDWAFTGADEQTIYFNFGLHGSSSDIGLPADADWSTTPIADMVDRLDGTSVSLADVISSADHVTGTTVTDSTGATHDVILVWERISEGTWTWYAIIDGGEAGLVPGMALLVSSGTVTFDESGVLIGWTCETEEGWAFTGAAPMEVIPTLGLEGSTSGTTRYSGPSSTTSVWRSGAGCTFVDAFGNPITSTVTMALTSFDPTEDKSMASRPGDFVGRDAEGLESPIASFGYFQFQAVEEDGDFVYVAEGAPITMETSLLDPIPTGQADLVDWTEPEMPMWVWNPDDAKWDWFETVPVIEVPEGGYTVETPIAGGDDDGEEDPEGTGSLTTVFQEDWGPTYSWNCDCAYPDRSTCTTFTVLDPLGNPISGAYVEMGGLGYYVTHYVGVESGSTNSAGEVTLWGLSDSQAEVRASVTIGGVAFEETLAPYDTPTAVPLDTSDCPHQVTLVIPACIVGGDIQMMVNRFNEEYPDGTIESFTAPWGQSVYYEPNGKFEQCQPEWLDMEIGTCALLEGSGNVPGSSIEHEIIGAGDITRVYEPDTVAMDFLPYTDTEGRDIYTFQAGYEDWDDIGSRMSGDHWYDLKVQGEDGMPGFEAPDSVWLPSAPSFSSSEAVRFTRGRDLTLGIPTAENPDGLYISIHNIGKGTDQLLMCRLEDRGTITVPGEATAYLDAGEVTIAAMRPGVEYATMPTGYVTVITALNAAQVNGTAE